MDEPLVLETAVKRFVISMPAELRQGLRVSAVSQNCSVMELVMHMLEAESARAREDLLHAEEGRRVHILDRLLATDELGTEPLKPARERWAKIRENTWKKKSAFLGYYESGMTSAECCRRAEITPAALYSWARTDAKFLEEWNAIRRDFGRGDYGHVDGANH